MTASEATTASKQPLRTNKTPNLESVTTIIYISMCILLIWSLMVTSEATTASKQPLRSNQTSDLKSMTSITYISMCILLIFTKFT